MAKQKRKLTAAEKSEKQRKRKEYMTIFINGKQKHVKRPPTINGMDVDEFIRRNADTIWLHQNEMWEYMDDFQFEGDTDEYGQCLFEGEMTNEEIQAVTSFGLRLIETEFAHFSENCTDNTEYVSAIKRIADTAFVFLKSGSASKTICTSVKEQFINRGRELFVQEWMNPLEDDDDESPDADEAIEVFNSLLNRK